MNTGFPFSKVIDDLRCDTPRYVLPFELPFSAERDINPVEHPQLRTVYRDTQCAEPLLDLFRIKPLHPRLRCRVLVHFRVEAKLEGGVIDVGNQVAGNAVAPDDEDFDVPHSVNVLVAFRLCVCAIVGQFGAAGEQTGKHHE
jgi:hypothetical protein